MSGESYNGIPIPDGWQRVRTGEILATDRMYEVFKPFELQWTTPPAYVIGEDASVYYCVIRRIEPKEDVKQRERDEDRPRTCESEP